MKTIRVEIDNGIDNDCNLLMKDIIINNAQRVYKDGYNKIKIIPFKSTEEITIEFEREVIYIEGVEI